MDDNLSIKSSDSVTTSGEYEIVPEAPALDALVNVKSGVSPTLNIANNGNMNDLEKNLNEVIHELDEHKKRIEENVIQINPSIPSTSNAIHINDTTLDTMEIIPITKINNYNSLEVKPSNKNDLLSQQITEINKVGQSIFYDCIDLSPSAEKQDDMKPERSDTEEDMSDIDQDCTVFSGVTYLGAAAINAPKSENEIHRNLAELNSISNAVGLKVSVSIPTCSEGLVVLYDAGSNAVVATYEVHRILFYARGPIGSVDQACFAFTWSHGDSQESAVFQCHVFRCHIPEAVTQVSSCFAKAFQRVPQSLTGSITSTVDNNVMMSSITSDVTGNHLSSAEYEFIVSLEIREKVAKNSYSAVRRDRSCFILRCNTDKEVSITVKQTPSTTLPQLFIERCFGVLLSPGKLVRQADMQLLDMVSMGYLKADSTTNSAGTTTTTTNNSSGTTNAVTVNQVPYQINAEWKANDKAFEQLNLESHKMYITVAVDLVIKGIQEPVRFVIETPVTILSQSEIRIRDHFISKRSMVQRFYLQLKESGEGMWEVNSIDPSEEIIEGNQSSSILRLGINFKSKMVHSSSAVSIDQDDILTDYSSDGDEPLLSGTGEVSKDCSEDTLFEWDAIIKEWDGERRPRNLVSLVRLGVPEAYRHTVWQKLACVENKIEMVELYRVLLSRETACEAVIQRDIHRTFPAHKEFKDSGGSGQDALYKVSKAYAVYDSEVGYCQGLSFVAASLLLHMPEEEAFNVLVALMYNYGLRDMYKHGFESLYLRLYQLNRLMKEHLPKLYEHFLKTGIETHMFASQWFLTLFTARFPLYFVFHVLDVFLLEGLPILFQVALTLLSVCENDLRQLDFEGILKYFRVTLPKKCRSQGQSRRLMKMACERKVKKLKQYEEEFMNKKELAEREEIETRHNEEKRKLQAEVKQLTEKLDSIKISEKKNAGIILDYKQIILRHEQQITKLNEMLDDITKVVSNCTTCSSNIQPNSPLHRTFSTNSNSQCNNKQIDAPLGPLDPLNVAYNRIRELELELVQSKVAHAEAECKSQNLNHQLNTTLTEINTNNRGSWQPWLSKTLNSIQEKVATRRDIPTFQSYTNQETTSQVKLRENSPTLKYKLAQQRNSLNRNSCDLTKTNEHQVLKDSLSCNSLK